MQGVGFEAACGRSVGRGGRSRRRKRWIVRALTCAGVAVVCTAFNAVASSGAKPAASAPVGQTIPYATKIAASGDGDLDAAINASSDLLSLQKTQAVGPFALAGRIRSDYGRVKTALESFGYYDGAATITVQRPKSAQNPQESNIQGNDIGLPQWLADTPKGVTLKISISVKRGPQYSIGAISMTAADGEGQVTLSDSERQAFGLKTGNPAIAATVLSAGGSLETRLKEEGHPLAAVATPTAYLRPTTRTLDLRFPVTIGPRANIGAISLDGLQRTHPAFIRRAMTVAPGQLYQPSKIEDARQGLASLGVFSTVGVKDAPKLAPDGTMPLTFNFQEAKRHSIGAEVAYSTDLGGRVGTTWTHYNLFGNAERLRLTALVTGLGGSAQQGLGYDVYADLFKPDFPGKNQNASFRVEGLRQLFYSYRQTALLARAGIVRRLNKYWNVNYGVAAEQESINQFGVTRDYTLVFAPLTATFDNTEVSSPLVPATHGFRVSLSATPSASVINHTSFFALLQANASTYFDLARFGLSKEGRSVFAFRAIVGSVQGASTYDIPPDQRLYGGGSATIRGFRYQGVGPQFAGTKYAIGGTSLDAGTVEFRQRILSSFGAAAFVDAGQVGSGSSPFTGTLRVGAGGGVRYYTPIGPIRLDIAVPLNRPPRGDKWELYIGLGETF
nr:BamA/TamA family outer membrane protein [Acetobacter sacchari]